MSKIEVDLVVHIPLDAEFREFVEFFPTGQNLTQGVNVTYIVDAPSGLKVVVTLQDKMGPTSALSACAAILERYKPKLYVCLGIAGGLSKDLRLGDVCYTGNLVDVLGNSKITDADGGGMDVEFSPEFYETDRKLTAAIGFVRTMTELRGQYEHWQLQQQLYNQSLSLGPVLGRSGEETIEIPESLNGYLVCGSVAQSNLYQDRLKGVTRNLLAIETESGVVFNYCREQGIDVLVIRGISDYADPGKTKLEGETKNIVRKIAARNAASFLHLQLENPTFLAAFSALSGTGNGSPMLPLPGLTNAPCLPAVLDEVAQEIDEKLRELSPQYRTKPRGYRLPTPRLREIGATSLGDGLSRPSALELTSALTRYRNILVHVPRTYPDPALSWILANGLILGEIAGKKLIPVVINGPELAPPKAGLQQKSRISISSTIAEEGGEYVFIIDGPMLSSKTRVAFIAEEMKKWDSSRFIFVTRDEKSLIKEADFERLVAATGFDVCDVSFSEMAAFLQNCYEMPSAQAEVTALKLRTMFQRFSLPAHPSFFAGIPQETLSALLLANRRSELIQLAVDGFLSFIVATDTDPVRMSRTNRANFLRRLVVELALEKRSFTQAQLVDYAQNISDEFDYGFNALSFIQAFEERGIIHFDGGKVVVTLPFIQAYLLADELSKREELAFRYFDAESDEFDLLTFDLYSEIGPSPEFVRKFSDSLETLVLSIRPTFAENILATNDISPAILKNVERLRGLSRRVSEAKDALESGANELDEKVKILDLVDRVNEDVAKESSDDRGLDTESEAYKRLSDLARRWLIASILLGSGAESIKGAERTRLARLVLESAECLTHLWTEYANSVDLGEVKKTILADVEFRKRVGIDDDKEYDNLVASIVDLVEYMLLSMPLERVINQLLDQAHHRIIGNSVVRAKVDTPVANLIRGLWLTDISPELGASDLRAAVTQLPAARFMRAILTSLLVFRVKWKLSNKKTRHILLDTAEALVKPLNAKLDKGELLRFVDREGAKLLSGIRTEDD